MGNVHFSFLLKVGLALCMGLITRLAVHAQCSGTLATHTYDTLLTSNGYGVYPLTIPQMSPDSGLLMSVKLSANVSSQYGYTLRNATSAQASYALSLGQLDEITSPALSSPYSNVMSKDIDSFSLTPGQSVTNGPFAFLSNHISSDSISNNVAPFLGSGQVNVKYTSFTFTDLNSYDNATYYYSASINNTMHFTVSYLYCAAAQAVLAVKLSNWGAQLVTPGTAELKWTATNETAGRSYIIQRSGDGQTFRNIHTVSALVGQTEDYDYIDNLPASTSGNWFYRLQINDQGGASYSSIKEVSAGASAGSSARLSADSSFSVYPNPSDTYINVNTGGTGGTWQADIVGISGSLVQRGTYSESGVVHIPFGSRLASGEYFVRMTQQGGSKSFVSKFIVVHGN